MSVPKIHEAPVLTADQKWMSALSVSDELSEWDFWSVGIFPISVTLNGFQHQLGNHSDYISKPRISDTCQRCGSGEQEKGKHLFECLQGKGKEGISNCLFILFHYSKQQTSMIDANVPFLTDKEIEMQRLV